MAMSRPLLIAVIAFGLLAASVGFESVFHRTFSVEVRDSSGWVTIGESRTASTPYPVARAGHPVTVAANQSVEFRVRVDNGYPWAYSHHYDVIGSQGFLVADGTLTSAARDVGSSTFTIPYATLVAGNGAPTKAIGGNSTFAYFTVQIGATTISASTEIREAAS